MFWTNTNAWSSHNPKSHGCWWNTSVLFCNARLMWLWKLHQKLNLCDSWGTALYFLSQKTSMRWVLWQCWSMVSFINAKKAQLVMGRSRNGSAQWKDCELKNCCQRCPKLICLIEVIEMSPILWTVCHHETGAVWRFTAGRCLPCFH